MKLVLAFLLVALTDVSVGQLLQTTQRCDQLPKANFDIREITKINPSYYHFTMDSASECAISVSIEPVKNKRGYDGTIIRILGNTVHTFDFIASADNKSVDVIACESGQRVTMHAIDFKKTPTGVWYCAYGCAADGIALVEFLCSATDASFIPEEMKAVAAVKGVPGWDNIKDARVNCASNKFCNVLL